MRRFWSALIALAIVSGGALASWGQDSVPLGRVQPRAAAAGEVTENAPAETAEAEKEAGPTLTVGDVAPAIDVRYWVQDGDKAWEHITEFTPGNIYVVEFWATWCGPCVAAMPHVSELQAKYAEQGVQMISISNEPLKTIGAFLKKSPAGEEQTYDEITANYCLTTDPDGSVHRDYMDAAARNGIPCAFLVGKEGKIEWVGHPMAIDEPLAQVVEGTWDREAFRVQFEAEQKLQSEISKIMRLASGGDATGANAKLDALAEELGDAAQQSIAQARAQIELYAFRGAVTNEDENAAAMLPQLIASLGGSAGAAGHVVSMVVTHAEGGGTVSKKLREAAIDATEEALDDEPGRFEAPLMMLIAKLEASGGDDDAAIEWMEKAVAAAPKASRAKLMAYLRQLRDEDEDDADDGDTADDAAEEATDEAQ